MRYSAKPKPNDHLTNLEIALLSYLHALLPPRGHVYPLLLPETKDIEEYITEALAQGYICPSVSPAVTFSTNFFFVEKKHSGLGPN